MVWHTLRIGPIGWGAIYAELFLDRAGLRCRWDLPAELPFQFLSAEIRHHLLLVAKEALNNAAKHAGATEVRLGLNMDKDQLIMVIEDNGCGFQYKADATTAAEDVPGMAGSGLRNMERRINLLGGRFSLASQAGQGTRITVRVPIARRT